MRVLVLFFGLLCYVIFLGAFLYQIGFLANRLVTGSRVIW